MNFFRVIKGKNAWIFSGMIILTFFSIVMSITFGPATITSNDIFQCVVNECASVSYTHLTLPTTPYV